jgi:hypothetical protein
LFLIQQFNGSREKEKTEKAGKSKVVQQWQGIDLLIKHQMA